MTGRDGIVFLARGLWEERWTTYQRLARELARSFRLLYVEGNYSWGKIARRLAGEDYPIAPFGRLREVPEGFHVLTPPPRLPLRNHLRAAGALQQAMLARTIRRACRRLGFERPVLWSFLHQSERIFGRCGERTRVYHCVDHWPWLIGKLPLMGARRHVEEDERRTAAAADFTVATSRYLRDRLAAANPRSHWVPNAADVDLFARAADGKTVVPDDLASIRKPVLGFSGTLEVKTDLDLLRRMALDRPDWSFAFIGHAENVPDLAKIRGLPNAHFLGLKRLDEMPAYLKGFDVCLVPFRRTPELESISSLKVFEYLAAGRPVVATRYGETEDLGHVVHLCDGPEDFSGAIERALADDGPEARARRLAFARENTWAKRGERLVEILREYEGGADPGGAECSRHPTST